MRSRKTDTDRAIEALEMEALIIDRAIAKLRAFAADTERRKKTATAAIAKPRTAKSAPDLRGVPTAKAE
jgi:hypothetical protein